PGLFDRHASPDEIAPRFRNGETLTSKMRMQRIKLVCYVNTEVNSSRSTVVQLPESQNSMGEVIAYVQKKMQLDKRMLYAKKLYTPNGTLITNWEDLTNAAAYEIPIIVSCGEPFDPTTVPASMVAFQAHGGGRAATQLCKQELQVRRKKAAHLKADQVRKALSVCTSPSSYSSPLSFSSPLFRLLNPLFIAKIPLHALHITSHSSTLSYSSHSPPPAPYISSHHKAYSSPHTMHARVETLERNRDLAAHMRHEFMENLLVRAAKHEEAVSVIRNNNEKLRAERDARTHKTEVFARDRALEQAVLPRYTRVLIPFLARDFVPPFLTQAEERKRAQSAIVYEKQQLLQDQANERAQRARKIRQKRKEGAQAVKEQLAEKRRLAGIERRVSHITRALQKAELEEFQLKVRQQQREAIKGGSHS
ncbi:MAG: hypothetical protein SGPRY_012806, partial [Prymnesium sp.]